jgi:hypothetical protein
VTNIVCRLSWHKCSLTRATSSAASGAPAAEQPDRSLGSRHVKRGGGAFVRHVSHDQTEPALGYPEAIVQVAADLPRGLQRCIDAQRILGGGRWKVGGDHAELQHTRDVELVLQTIEAGAHLIAQSLLFQARADARAQERRVERLGKVILGAELDAAYDAFDLVDRRDHDYRQVPQLGVALEMLEHLITVHLRHHDIEQHQIERSGSAEARAPRVRRWPS